MKRSKSQTIIKKRVETEFLPTDFAQQLRRKNADVPDVYLALFDAAGISLTLNVNQNATTQKRKLGPFQNLQSLYTQGGAYEPVLIFLNSRNLPVLKVRHFVHSKPSYTNFTLPQVNSRE